VALFAGQYKSLMTCQRCKFDSARFEPYTFLQLPLPAPANDTSVFHCKISFWQGNDCGIHMPMHPLRHGIHLDALCLPALTRTHPAPTLHPPCTHLYPPCTHSHPPCTHLYPTRLCRLVLLIAWSPSPSLPFTGCADYLTAPPLSLYSPFYSQAVQRCW
jgi:hypothetical protein